jgi:hypothetical protein
MGWTREKRVGEDLGSLGQGWGAARPSGVEHGLAVGDAGGKMDG